jgi:hypothetical protein
LASKLDLETWEMRLVHDSQTFGFLPEAHAVLTSHFQTTLYHGERGCRTPAGIYSVSLGQVLSRFELLMAERASVASALCSEQDSHRVNLRLLLERLDALLDALAEHVEDCLSILGCFFPRVTDHTKDPTVRRFSNAADSYRRFITHRVNHIKHRHGRIRPAIIEDGGTHHLGYFFEGVWPDGSIGPDTTIHRRVEVYSLARDLRFHIYNLYYVGRELAHAAKEIGRPTSSLPNVGGEVSQRFVSLIRSIASLPRIVFPGEQALEWPEVCIQDEESSIVAELHIIAPPAQTISETQIGANITIAYESDGTPNQKYAMPLHNTRRTSPRR